ncbi:MAG: hypothetical protein LBG70_00750, partial [Bifidobacteriaceae bacterium]|nr:hypothetical protein [Bifidobacteriaceae bacterium]
MGNFYASTRRLRRALTVAAVGVGLAITGLTPAAQAANVDFTGTVYYVDGVTPATGVEVELYSVDCTTGVGDDFYLDWDETGSTGQFSFYSLDTDRCYYFEFDFQVTVAGGSGSPSYSFEWGPNDPSNSYQFNLTSNAPAKVNFSVSNYAGDQYYVSIRRQETDGTWGYYTGLYLDSAGRHTVDLPAGYTYAAKLYQDSVYAEQWLNGAGNHDDNPPSGARLTIAANQAGTTVNWATTALKGSGVTGKVNLNGEQAQNASVTLYQVYTDSYNDTYLSAQRSAKLQADGTFGFGGLTPGVKYSLAVYSDNWADSWLGGYQNVSYGSYDYPEVSNVATFVAPAGENILAGQDLNLTTKAAWVSITNPPRSRNAAVWATSATTGKSTSTSYNGTPSGALLLKVLPGVNLVGVSTEDYDSTNGRYTRTSWSALQTTPAGAITAVTAGNRQVLDDAKWIGSRVISVTGKNEVQSTLTAAVAAKPIWEDDVDYGVSPVVTFGWSDGASLLASGSATYQLTPNQTNLPINAFAVISGPGVESQLITVAAGKTAPIAAQQAPIAKTVSGTAKVGATLTAPTLPLGATATYAWLRDGKAISGASKATYKAVAADAGHKLSVKLDVTRTG